MNKDVLKLVEIANGMGLRIEFKDLPGKKLGQCIYEDKVIFVKKDESARQQLIILAHEMGHYHSYLDNERGTNISRNEREKLAYSYGFRFLVNTRLSKKYNITPEEWWDINFPNFTNIAPDVNEAWT